jgi:hypothetical protein
VRIVLYAHKRVRLVRKGVPDHSFLETVIFSVRNHLSPKTFHVRLPNPLVERMQWSRTAGDETANRKSRTNRLSTQRSSTSAIPGCSPWNLSCYLSSCREKNDIVRFNELNAVIDGKSDKFKTYFCLCYNVYKCIVSLNNGYCTSIYTHTYIYIYIL